MSLSPLARCHEIAWLNSSPQGLPCLGDVGHVCGLLLLVQAHGVEVVVSVYVAIV